MAVSFDPRETPVLASGKKKAYTRSLQAAGIGGRLAFPDGCRGLDQGADRCGGLPLRVGRQEPAVRAPERHCHRDAGRPGVALLLRDRVRVARREVRADGVVGREASATRSISCLLYCYHYDPATGSYGFVAMGAVRIGGAVTLLALLGFVVVSIAREPRSRRRNPGALSYVPIRHSDFSRAGVHVRQGRGRALFFHHRGLVVLRAGRRRRW